MTTPVATRRATPCHVTSCTLTNATDDTFALGTQSAAHMHAHYGTAHPPHLISSCTWYEPPRAAPGLGASRIARAAPTASPGPNSRRGGNTSASGRPSQPAGTTGVTFTWRR